MTATKNPVYLTDITKALDISLSAARKACIKKGVVLGKSRRRPSGQMALTLTKSDEKLMRAYWRSKGLDA